MTLYVKMHNPKDKKMAKALTDWMRWQLKRWGGGSAVEKALRKRLLEDDKPPRMTWDAWDTAPDEFPKRLYKGGHWMDVFSDEDETIARNSGWGSRD